MTGENSIPSHAHSLRTIRHEKPTDPDDPLADQNIKDRYYGINDPVADKLLKRASTMPRLDTPEDKSITTLYVGGLGDSITDSELRSVPAQYNTFLLQMKQTGLTYQVS